MMNWQALSPVDGSLLVGILNNPTNAPFAVSGQWLWCYVDGGLMNRAGAGDGPAWMYSLEGMALPNAGHAGGGPGTQGTGNINANAGVDPYLVLDSEPGVSGGVGVNQMLAYVADQAGAVLAWHCELAYSPLYLYP